MNKQGLFASITLIALATSLSAHAANAQSFQQLQVSPVRQNLEVSPGETVSFEFKFYNLGEKTISGIVKSSDFAVVDNSGTPKILDTADQVLPRFSAAAWVTLPFDRLSIAAGDQAPVRVTIKVPSDARPGGRYVAVYFDPATGQTGLRGTGKEEAGAIISQRIAGLMYLRVKGAINEKAYISRLFGASFLEYGPINIETEILNRGDYHIRPRGSISLHNFFKSTVDQKALNEVNIFPDTSRSYKFELGKKWMFGRYTANIAASYGDSGQIIQRSIDIWVFPWKIALALFLGLIMLIVLVRYIFKNYLTNQTVLEKELKKEHDEIEKLREELDEKK